jgi:hypothetical protein
MGARMPPLSYPDLSWSGRPNRFLRTLQVIAIAVVVGAAGGAVGALALLTLPSGPRDAAVAGRTPGAVRQTAQNPTLGAASQANGNAQADIGTPPQASNKVAALPVPNRPTGQSPAPSMPSTATAAVPPSPAGTPSSSPVAPPAPQPQHRAVAASEPSPDRIYDRVEPNGSARDAHNGSQSEQTASTGAVHGRSNNRHTRKSALTRASHSPATSRSLAPQTRYASRTVGAPPPPVVIVPSPQRRVFGDRRDPDWRYARRPDDRWAARREEWRDRRSADDWRDGGPPVDRGPPGFVGPFGLLFGGFGN